MNLSDRIVKLREVKGITQAEMARMLDMVQSNYARLEKRDNKLTLEQIEKIAEALNASVAELLGTDVNPYLERIQKLEEKNKNLREALKDTNTLREQFDYLTEQFAMFNELYKQTKQRSKEIRHWANDVVTAFKSGDDSSKDKLIKFIEDVYLSDER